MAALVAARVARVVASVAVSVASVALLAVSPPFWVQAFRVSVSQDAHVSLGFLLVFLGFLVVFLGFLLVFLGFLRFLFRFPFSNREGKLLH